jgi:MFS family permease
MSPRRALDWLNFLLTDVRGCLGPYLGIFLLTQEHWSAATIGLVMTVGAIVGLTLQAAAGAFMDTTPFKRGSVVVSLMVMAMGAVAMALWPTITVVTVANTAMAVVGDVLGPAVVAITLGVLGTQGLAAQLGRNSAMDHAGNIFIAAVAGFVGWWWSQRAAFFLAPLFACLSALAVLAIPAGAIDHARARGLDAPRDDGGIRVAGWLDLLQHRPLMIFAVCVALFHFANAPMLPLVGQKLALTHAGEGAALMSACIIAAQVVMVPIALWVARKAQTWGHRPLFLAALGILPIRGVLYTLSDDRFWLVSVQLLDGIGAGILGVLTPLMLADLTHGTGRYNASQGIVATVQGVSVAISNAVVGFIVVRAGYGTAFITLAAIASLALLVFLFIVPETRRESLPNKVIPHRTAARRLL